MLAFHHNGGLLPLIMIVHALIHTQDVRGVDQCPPGTREAGANCFVPMMDEKLSYEDAEMECSYSGGTLAIPRDDNQANEIREMADDLDWGSVWMGAMGDYLHWIWEKNGDLLQYQGCWDDRPDNPALPGRQSQVQSAGSCLTRCKDEGFQFAGIQIDNGLVCHCGHEFRETQRKSDDACKDSCPPPPSGGPHFHHCGGTRRQIILVARDGLKMASDEIDAWEGMQESGACALIQISYPDAKWKQYNCRKKKAFICEYKQKSRSNCNSNDYRWLTKPPTCISLHNNTASWFKARSICRSKNGKLFMMKPRDLKDFDPSFTADAAGSYWWIGLTRYDWRHISDDSPVIYNGWAENSEQPDYRAMMDGDVCIAGKQHANYRWFNEDCDRSKNFFCELDPEDAQEVILGLSSGNNNRDLEFPTTIDPPPNDISGEDGEDGEDGENDKKKGNNNMIITAAVAAGVGVTVVLLIIGAVLACRRCRRKKHAARHDEQPAHRGPLPRVPQSKKARHHSGNKPGHKSGNKPSKTPRTDKAVANRYVTSPGVDNSAYTMSDPPMKILNHMPIPDDDGEYDYIDHDDLRKEKKTQAKTYESLNSKNGSVRHVYDDMAPNSREGGGGVMNPVDEEYFVPVDPNV